MGQIMPKPESESEPESELELKRQSHDQSDSTSTDDQYHTPPSTDQESQPQQDPKPQPPSTSRNQDPPTPPTATTTIVNPQANFYRDIAGYRIDPSISGPIAFSYNQLARATNNFDPISILGEGGFGRVYKGVLESGQTVAIKHMASYSYQGPREFLTEVLTLSFLRHPNVITMIGYCYDIRTSHHYIVYEFMPSGDLKRYFHKSDRKDRLVDWNTRMQIAIGVAKGMNYLHVEAAPTVIFRDLKLSNILLSKDLNPKISDFGISLLCQNLRNQVYFDMVAVGTDGYCSPEYARSGRASTASDVFSFGVVLLELITGRRAMYNVPGDGEGRTLVSWVMARLSDGCREHMLEAGLRGEVPVQAIHTALDIAVQCVADNPENRPNMTNVTKVLEDCLIALAPEAPMPPRKKKKEDKKEKGVLTTVEEVGKVSTLPTLLTSKQIKKGLSGFEEGESSRAAAKRKLRRNDESEDECTSCDDSSVFSWCDDDASFH
ncbi:probable serine/threonine-protein kinase PBL21 [Andrographis paniculata]|uniref:probable serine/threonine-protein kinase PBL21 n=1 Tax=Andrographis paniculata TaxID=175694 RepID=UPI0021E86A76|nr:probable serine/threonine-protein kinase PBL21 [Andrographis paniculata]